MEKRHKPQTSFAGNPSAKNTRTGVKKNQEKTHVSLKSNANLDKKPHTQVSSKTTHKPPYQEGKKVEEGSTVKIILSKGPETTELPDFTEKDIEEVRQTASKMGIILDEKTENSDKVAENKVISQDTKAGVLVKSGDTITIHVSAGVKKTTVPTVVDMDEGTAKATLKNSNLNANVTYANDSTKTDGKVISQSIEQGKEIAEGTTVELVVNKIEAVKKAKYRQSQQVLPIIQTLQIQYLAKQM